MSQIQYSCTALVGTNKSGILKPDEFGRYDMVLGALEYPNSVGDIYTLSSAQEFFKEGSPLLRRISNGQLRAELGHPKRLPGMTDRDYLERILTIEETRVCAHISDIFIDHDSVKDKFGRNIITIRGKVKPSGPYGHVLKEMLDDPKQNVAFSVRSLTSNKQVGFRQHKDFTQIITWDYVNEPGLAPANKYGVPTLESNTQADMSLNVETLYSLAEQSSLVSNESTTLINEAINNINRVNNVNHKRIGW